MVLNVWTNIYGVDLVCGNPNSQGVDPEVGTLEEPDEGNSPQIIRDPGDNVNDECRSPLNSTNMKIQCPGEMISQFLCDVNSSAEDYTSAKIWKSAHTLEQSFY